LSTTTTKICENWEILKKLQRGSFISRVEIVENGTDFTSDDLGSST